MNNEQITNALREAGVVEAVLPFSDYSMRILKSVTNIAMRIERESCINDVRTIGGNFAVECEELILSRKIVSE